MEKAQKLIILSLLTSLIASFFYYLAIWLDIFLSSLFLYGLASCLIALNIYSLKVNYQAQKLKILLMMILMNIFILIIFSALTISIL